MVPTQAEVDEFQAATDDIKAVMVASLVAYWIENVEANPAESIGELREFTLGLVAEYGQTAAATAIDFYESVRPAGAPSFEPVPVVRDDLVGGGSLNWATQPLLTETWEQALDRISAEIQKATMEAAIETIGEATLEDPLDVRYARYPQDDDPCAYCVLRASRGAIYWSEDTAARGDHVYCKCRITPVFPDEPLPYLRAPYMAQYQNGAAEAADAVAAIRADHTLAPAERQEAEFKALLAGMRRANGLR